jgi:8-oxo-dGTP diphosphatase
MATDWSDPVVVSAVGVGVATVAATVWAGWWTARKEKRKKAKSGHATVAVGIVQKGKEVILVQRIKAERGILWQFPAGMINPKRTAAETVVREVEEETGVKCEVIRQIGEREHPATGAVLAYFHCQYVSGTLRNGDPKENAEVIWVKAAEAQNKITSDLFPAVAGLLSGLDE